MYLQLCWQCADMLSHEVKSLLYCFNEANVLAHYIERIFESDELALRYSKAARACKQAEVRRNCWKNVDGYILKLQLQMKGDVS